MMSPENLRKPPLEPIAMTVLEAGRMMMESGAYAASVQEVVDAFARGLGAERTDLRVGYASLAITICIGESGITRMCKVGHIGVNQRLDQQVWDLGKRVSRDELTTEETRAELARIQKETPRYTAWVTALAVGVACAGFGRLFAVDWNGIGPVFVAALTGQYVRSGLLARGFNAFISIAAVAFLSSTLGGIGALWAGSATHAGAMVASILMLVPGVPAVNAQRDILEGHPTLGSARLVAVVMMLVFLAVGLWCGQGAIALLGIV